MAFLGFRHRAALLAQEIPRDLTSLTVHDISHIDALWETADIILGDEIALTPLEAFVLGCAFLIHDLGLGLVAYPNGLSDLQKEPEWLDYMTTALRRFLGREPEPSEIANPPDQPFEEVKFLVMRNAHARLAEQLVSMEWPDKASGKKLRLLEDPELANAVGPIIGEVAHSHWWSTEKVSKAFAPRIISPPVGFPRTWEIDALKIALTLRLADIAHLDARRAPTFLKLLRKPAGSSSLHWAFQEKLFQVRRDGERLVYTGRPFTQSDAQAWWLCFDTLRAVDEELRRADNLNVDLQRKRFAAKGVRNVEDPLRLKELIPTAGWDPVDARIRVGHVASLVSRLGGRELYGDDDTVPLRELIQNAADAIRARRILENRPTDWGTISLKLGEDSSGGWIEIGDNGVGMSTEVLTGPFLDFGNSFWNTEAAVSQFPTLISRGFQSTGKYGIGFFSVFMWADRVRVTTRRFDESVSQTRVLEFDEGLGVRPILRVAHPNELIREGGTQVRVWPRGIKNTRDKWIGIGDHDSFMFLLERHLDPISATFWLCPMFDTDIFVEDGLTSKGFLLRAADWMTIEGKTFLRRILSGFLPSDDTIEKWGGNVRLLRHSGSIVGRGCIVPGEAIRGCVTIGGCRSKTVLSIAAGITGESARAARDEARITISADELAAWATEQAGLVHLVAKEPEQLARCAQTIALLGGDIGSLPIAKGGGAWMDSGEVATWARDKETVILLELSKAEKLQAGYKSWIFNENVLIEPDFSEEWIIAPIYRFLRKRRQPDSLAEKKAVRRPVVLAVASAWRLPPESLEIWSGDGFDVSAYSDGVDAEGDHPPF